MATPIIDDRTSILSIAEGGTFSFQPSAANSPTSWAASGLPSGLSINSSTGAITGTITADSGIYHVTLSATNADGTDELVLIIPVFDTPEVIAGEITIEMNVDLISGAVTVLGMGEGELSPPTSEQRDDGLRKAVLLVKEGDRFPVSIGFTRDGVLQDLTLRSLRMKCKEFEPDAVLALLEGDFTKTGSGDTTRFESVLNVKERAFAGVLSNYEEDFGTYLDALAEIEFSILVSSNSYDTTKAESFTLTGSDTETDTLVFTGLPDIETETEYTLDIDLAVTGATDQNASLALTLDIAFDSETGLFVPSNLTGSTSAQGDVPSAIFQWRSTLTHVSVTGTADGVEVVVTVTTSDVGTGDFVVLPENSDWSIVSGSLVFDPYGAFYTDYEARDTSGGGAPLTGSFQIADGDTESTILTTLQALTEFSGADSFESVSFEDGIGIVIELNAGHNVSEIEDTLAAAIYYPQAGNSIVSKSASTSVQLAGDAIDDIYRRTSETFVLRTERDLIADA
jgi:hypothetical protein